MDAVSASLVRLQSQLDRIERRIASIDGQVESVQQLTARLTDVEDVIHVLGDSRSQRHESNDASHEANTVQPLGRESNGYETYAKTGQSNWAELDAMVGQGSGGPKAASTVTRLHSETAGEAPNMRNAELGSRDAATTLEFLTLGKDRRQGLAMNDTSSDSEPDSEAFAKRIQPRSRRQQTRTSTSASAESDKLLRHLRRQLSTIVLDRIELVLSQHADMLPPSNLLARPMSKPLTDRIKAVQMPPPIVKGVIYIAREFGAWQHCCVHFPTFEREVEAFLTITADTITADNSITSGHANDPFEGWRAIDPAWMALFFVICGIAIHQMSPDEGLDCNLRGEKHRNRLASDLLHAAMDALSLADYLVKPSVYSCQTIAILCVAGHNICGSDLLTSLLAIGIKTGQTLNLHALGKTASFLETCAHRRSKMLVSTGANSDTLGSCQLADETDKQFAVWKKRIIDLEVGKRVWWAFTQQDYFAIPFSGCFSIIEGQYDTPLPHNCSDEDLDQGRLINRKVDELTVASKQRFTCHVAKIVCDFFEDLNKTKDVPPLSLVLHHEERLRYVTERFRACLDSDRLHPHKAMLPAFSAVLQHYLFISVNHKILVMHRAFLSRRVSAEDRQLSHASTIETARAVLHELERGLGLNSDSGDRPQLNLQSRVHGGALWTIPYHSVAAATILALDIFRAPMIPSTGDPVNDHRPSRRQDVKRALNALGQLTEKSAIARRGCQLLSKLLEESRRFDERHLGPAKRKTSKDVDLVMKRIRLPEYDARDKVTGETPFNPSSPDQANRKLGNDAGWLDGFSADSYSGLTPDEPDSSPVQSASFGYGSTHFNPLAGNSTSRGGTKFPLIGTSESLSSMFLSSDASASAHLVTSYNPFPSSHFHALAQSMSPTQAKCDQQDRDASEAQSYHTAYWPHDASAAIWSTAPNTDINMSQQHLAQILPALESMPDVWKLFDGTLGQSLVAFEESGF